MAETMNKPEALKEAAKMVKFLEVFKHATTVIQLSLQADQDYHKVRMQIEAAKKQIDDLESLYVTRQVDVQEDHDDLIAVLNAQQAALMAEYAQAQTDALAANYLEIGQVRADLVALVDEVGLLQGQKSVLQAEVDQLRSEKGAILTAIAELRSRLAVKE